MRRRITRAEAFLRTAGLLAAWACTWLLLLTGQSFYRGTGDVKGVSPEVPAVARATACHREGPVSSDGLGYWWRCAATVRVEDRVMHVTVSHSVLTPADIGRPVEFREACRGARHTGCAYGRPVTGWWQLPVELMRVGWIVTVVGFAPMALLYLFIGVLGDVRASRALRSLRRRRRVARAPGRAEGT